MESTIVDLTGPRTCDSPAGIITREMLQKVVGGSPSTQAWTADDPPVRPKAPGMRYRHYAPKATMFIVEGEPERRRRDQPACLNRKRPVERKRSVIPADDSREFTRPGL